MTLFDRFVVVDWSASATPKSGADSIWIADLGDGKLELSNPRTRVAAFAQIADIIDSSNGRTLIGFDASLGYPTGTAQYFGLDESSWSSVWTEVAQLSNADVRNANNRFEVASLLNGRGVDAEGPFWGCPPTHASDSLSPTKPHGGSLPEFRQVERWLRSQGLYPKSCWQLLGAGSVGGQTLTLLPHLHARREQVDIWPFTTGLTAPASSRSATVVEVWPSLFDPVVPPGMVIDAAQVSHTARVLRDADRDGALAGWFSPPADRSSEVVSEEGWVLGVR